MTRRYALFAVTAAAAVLAVALWRWHSAARDTRLDALHVVVEREGRPVASVDRGLVDRTPPDFVEGGTRAWRLRSLLGADVVGATDSVIVEDSQGLRFVLATPDDAAEGRQPVLAIEPQGELRVALAADGEVFAALHGRDGQREHHSTDAGRRRTIRRILLATTHGSGNVGDSTVSISAVLDGELPSTWTRREFGSVPVLDIIPVDGEGHRAAWSLRELAHDLVGTNARVIEIVGEQGRRIAIDRTQWDNGSRLPVLRLNRRRLLKFEWIASDLSPVEGDRLREVTSIVLKRDSP